MIGELVGHYRIVEELGRGAMGVVYRAEDPRLGRDVALKFLVASDPALAADLMREARASASLTHPNICAVHDVGEHDGRPFMVMELVKGPDLRTLLETGDVEPARALELVRQVGAGLAAAHAEGLIHGDIKPDNIMMAADGQVRIMDFGLARALGDSGGEEDDEFAGTLSYLSPEALAGEAPGQAGDRWAFAATAYEILGGRPAFPGDYRVEVEYQIMSVDPEDLAEVAPACPGGVARAVMQALAKRPAERPDSMAAILDEIGKGAVDEVAATSATPSAGFESSRKWAPWMVAPVVLVAALLVWQFGIRGGGEKLDLTTVTLAVADFRGPEDEDHLGVGLTELLNIGLLEAAPVRMASREYLHDLRRRMFGESEGPLDPDESLAVSRRGEIDFLLAGQLIPGDGRDMITWRLIDVETGANVAANQVEGDQWSDLADRIIAGSLQALTGHLGADEPGIPVTVAELTTTYPDAYERYVGGLIHLRNLQYEPARQSLTQAVDIDSTFALAHFALSRIYSNVHGGIGDGQRTREHAEKAWRHRTRLGRKDRLRVKAWRAQISYRLTEARDTYAAMQGSWPDDHELIMDRLEFLHYRWYFKEGLAVAEEAVRYYADEPDVLDYQQDMLAAVGRSDRALEVTRRLVDLVPDEVSYWQELASRWLELGDADQAGAAVAQALELDADYLLGRIQQAQVLYSRDDLEGAIGALETLLDDPELGAGQRIMVLTSSSYRPSLTMLYGDAGRLAEAMEAFDRAEALAAGAPGTVMAIAGRRHRFLLRHVGHEETLEWARGILASDPDPSAWFNAALNGAVALSRADSLEAATALVDSLYGRENAIGGLARFMARRAEVALRLGASEPDSALAIIRAIRDDGLVSGGVFDIDVRRAKATALHASGRTDEALEELHDLLLVYPGHAPARLQLAQLLEIAGRKGEAAAECDRFLADWSSADPTHPTLETARRLRRDLGS